MPATTPTTDEKAAAAAVPNPQAPNPSPTPSSASSPPAPGAPPVVVTPQTAAAAAALTPAVTPSPDGTVVERGEPNSPYKGVWQSGHLVPVWKEAAAKDGVGNAALVATRPVRNLQPGDKFGEKPAEAVKMVLAGDAVWDPEALRALGFQTPVDGPGMPSASQKRRQTKDGRPLGADLRDAAGNVVAHDEIDLASLTEEERAKAAALKPASPAASPAVSAESKDTHPEGKRGGKSSGRDS